LTGRPQYPANREAVFLAAAVRRFLDKDIPPPDPEKIDPEQTLRLAVAHAVVPMVYDTVREAAPDHRLALMLRPAFENDARFSLALAGELRTIGRLLAEHEVAFVSLKGPLLSQRLYGDPAVRSPGDVDLLLHPGDIIGARDLLIAHDYRIASPLHWSGDAACLKSRECELLMVHRERQLAIDLHWRILPRYFPSAFDRIEVWNHLVSIAMFGERLPDLAPEHLLLFLCAHASKHAFERLSWICDIARCLRVLKLDWPAVISAAAASGTTRQLLTGMKVAADLLGAPLPSGLPADDAADRLAAVAIARLLGARPLPVAEAELIPFCLKMFPSPRHRARYLLGHLSPSDAEYAAVQIPPALHFLYYPLRPLRLASRFVVRRSGRRALPG